VEEIAQVENVEVVHVGHQNLWLTLQLGVLNIHGIKLVANVLFHTNQEEMGMLCFSTLTEPLTSDFGKSINQTGVHAVEEVHHAIFKLT
jgi:hypothetical protein